MACITYSTPSQQEPGKRVQAEFLVENGCFFHVNFKDEDETNLLTQATRKQGQAGVLVQEWVHSTLTPSIMTTEFITFLQMSLSLSFLLIVFVLGFLCCTGRCVTNNTCYVPISFPWWLCLSCFWAVQTSEFQRLVGISFYFSCTEGHRIVPCVTPRPNECLLRWETLFCYKKNDDPPICCSNSDEDLLLLLLSETYFTQEMLPLGIVYFTRFYCDNFCSFLIVLNTFSAGLLRFVIIVFPGAQVCGGGRRSSAHGVILR